MRGMLSSRRVLRSSLLLLIVLLSAAAGFSLEKVQGTSTGRRTPVIFDTDIGDDIDDTWALALLLKSPELDLKLVTTDYGNTVYRAKIVGRFLEIATRTDVSIGIGLKQSESVGAQAPWVERYDLSLYPGKVYQDGVQALIDTIMRSPQRVTLICTGPTPNIRAALDREPRIADRASFVGMYGSLYRGYDGKKTPDAEYNVRCDPEACRRALTAPWSITITPLDTCGVVSLRGKKYAAVHDCKDPMIRALMENYRIWLGGNAEKANTASSILFDTVAAYLSISEDLLVMKELGVRVTDDGHTVLDSRGKKMNCALEWKNPAAFEDFLVNRLTGR